VKNHITIISILLLLGLNGFGQYHADISISKDNLKPWKSNSTKDYTGTYQFGFSEGECELRIFIHDSIVVAQTSCFAASPITGGFIDTFRTFTDVTIKGNKFFSNETNGEFVIYSNEHGSSVGLLIHSPWTYKFSKGGEFGARLPDEGVYLVGEYSFASKRILSIDELKKYSSSELKIIRNEIYARYGYIFKKDGSMDVHFKKEKWFKPIYKTVEQYLTSIELQNIQTIKKAEELK
jgi:hypothetical protein